LRRTAERESRMRNLADRLLAASVLLMALPLLAAIAAAIALDNGFPVFYLQDRMGRGGNLFRLRKFRSMRHRSSGTLVTAKGDSRITRVGAFLRKLKLDELPQLWNVVRGDMALIGPRPEVPRYVEYGDPRWKAVLSVRPGITDLATLVYRDEEEILAVADDPELCYRSQVLPRKLALNLEYLRERTLATDLRLLALTVRYSFVPEGFRSEEIRSRVLGEDRATDRPHGGI
jgi:lipopolysaccharide/colanic/teichoic acid biosynthesis glycosyltransferase